MYEVGDTVNNLLILEKVSILSANYNQNGYKVKCLNDGYIFDKLESEIKRGRGCGVCSGNIVVAGINDINTTAKWMIDYIKNKEDSFKYSKSSGKRIMFKCPKCGVEKLSIIGNISMRGFTCNVCSDKISLGERVISSLFSQLNVDYDYQVNKNTLEWCENYKYDFYIPKYDWIIEVNGRQHYFDSTGVFKTTLEQQTEIDNAKYNLAVKNGVKIYTCLNFSDGSFEHMKMEVLYSKINDIYRNDMLNVDWNRCFSDSLKSYVSICASLYNKGYTKQYISDNLKISTKTVNDYLKKANSLGMCEYNTVELIKESKTKGIIQMIKATSKPVMVFKDGEFIGRYKSVSELCRSSIEAFGVEFKQQSVSRVCNGKLNKHKGFTFTYEDIKEHIVE